MEHIINIGFCANLVMSGKRVYMLEQIWEVAVHIVTVEEKNEPS